MGFPNSTFEAVIRASLGVPDTTELPFDAPLTDFGLDSLGSVNLVLDLELGFDAVIPDTALLRPNFYSAETLWQALAEILTGAGPA